MSWAAKRQTTRPEDIAYCLLGLFDVNMPLLYGEGSTKAFMRLQQEFLRASEDESIFAWWRTETLLDSNEPHPHLCGLLAPSPEYFSNSGDIKIATHTRFDMDNRPTELTNRGLHQLPLCPIPNDPSRSSYFAVLHCYLGEPDSFGRILRIAIILQQLSPLGNHTHPEQLAQPSLAWGPTRGGCE